MKRFASVAGLVAAGIFTFSIASAKPVKYGPTSSGGGTVSSATAPLSIADGGVMQIAAATDSLPGSMSAADKTKLDRASGTLVGPVVGTSTASWTVSGLNGETDGDYEGVIHLIPGPGLSGGGDLQFLPNGSTSNTDSFAYQVFGTSVTPFKTVAYLTCGNFTAGDDIEIRWRISSKKQAGRLFECDTYRVVGATQARWTSAGRWIDGTATMTSFTIRFASNVAGDLAAGSFMKWRPLGFSAG